MHHTGQTCDVWSLPGSARASAPCGNSELTPHVTLDDDLNRPTPLLSLDDDEAFLGMRELVEFDRLERIFSNPRERRTEDDVTGKFG